MFPNKKTEEDIYRVYILDWVILKWDVQGVHDLELGSIIDTMFLD